MNAPDVHEPEAEDEGSRHAQRPRRYDARRSHRRPLRGRAHCDERRTAERCRRADGSESAARPWAYRIGEAGDPRQGNFCDDSDAALEIAQIFDRFGARTGFSALSNAPACATRVHAVTPESLLREVAINTNNEDRRGNIITVLPNLRASYGIFLIGKESA